MTSWLTELDAAITWAIQLEPFEVLERLAAMTRRPRVNLLIYHGVFAGHARQRKSAVARALAVEVAAGPAPEAPPEPAAAAGRAKRRHRRWADLMSRVFAADVLACPRCDGRLRLIATIASPEAIRRILAHIGLPRRCRGRAPPGLPRRRTRSSDPHA
jgi:hypothetical protein